MLEFDTPRVHLEFADGGLAVVLSSSPATAILSRTPPTRPRRSDSNPVTARPSSPAQLSHASSKRVDSPAADAVGETAVVVAVLPNKMVMVETASGDRVAAHAAKDLRMSLVRLLVGDGVRIERSPLDATKARILSLDRAYPQSQRRAPNPQR
jgi:translation initiation factor IF-1